MVGFFLGRLFVYVVFIFSGVCAPGMVGLPAGLEGSLRIFVAFGISLLFAVFSSLFGLSRIVNIAVA